MDEDWADVFVIHMNGVSAYANIIYSISVELMCIFKLISKETCNTKKVTFHGYFHCVKFYFDRSKGEKLHFGGVLLPGIISTHLGWIRIKHISSTRIS